jgi:UDP-N-acetyl-D-glucosamine dehydrogenase
LPALRISRGRGDLGAEVAYHDPHVLALSEFGLESIDLEEGLGDADLATIVTAHPGIDYAEVVAAAPRVIDFRGVTRGIEARSLVRL